MAFICGVGCETGLLILLEGHPVPLTSFLTLIQPTCEEKSLGVHNAKTNLVSTFLRGDYVWTWPYICHTCGSIYLWKYSIG